MNYIKKEEIAENGIKLYKAPVQLDKYDMYYVKFLMKTGLTKQVRVFCEKGTFPEFNSNEFKVLQQMYGSELLTDFFIKRLIGEQGLMNKEGRDDFIYLGGEVCKNGHIANRHMIQGNGKTGQENFDENLFRLKLQVTAQEQNIMSSNEKKGKTYVIGDIHGMYGSYMEIMKKMTPKDHLIILGDVIDRGLGGIQIIQDIMQRKQNRQNNPEITFMLGNHEMQFLETAIIMNRKGLTVEDLTVIFNRRFAFKKCGNYSLKKSLSSEEKKDQEKWEKEFAFYDEEYKKLIKEKNLEKRELMHIETWLDTNKGYTTVYEFQEDGRAYDEKEQLAIYKFLFDSYVILPQNINGQDYLFVHAMPPQDSQMISEMKQTKKGYKFGELKEYEYKFMLQQRENSTYEQAKAYGFTTICGHTPELGRIIVVREKGFVRIDAGCGHKKSGSKLALYCVDDGKVEYFDEKETTQEKESYK